MAHIRKFKKKDGSERYEVQIRLKDCPKHKQYFDNENEAKEWAKIIEEEYRYNRNFKIEKNEKHLFVDVMSRYCTYHLPNIKDGERRKSQLKWWSKYFSKNFIDEITSEMIEKAIKELSTITTRFKTQITNATLQRYIGALSHFFTIAMKEWKLVTHHPVVGIELPGSENKKRIRIGSHHHEKRNPWISVTQKLPEEDTAVLALSISEYHIEVACYNPYNDPDNPNKPKGWETQDGFLLTYDITHWMEIPELF